jgi:ABC-type transport system involved in multi-copper enzyme maturation permease subunit
MTFLPIVARELLVAARRPMTYWSRAAVVLVVVIVSAWVFMVQTGARSSEIGRMLFYVLTAGAGFYCLFAGVRSTADCLSEEKREGTLGLLFLTSLRGHDIVLGKLAANSLGSIYGLLAIIPALGLPLLLGGTPAGQFARVSLGLLATLLFSLTAGLLASAMCRSSRKAMSLAFLIILFFTGGLPALGTWLAYVSRNWQSVQPFLLTSPVFNYVAALDVFRFQVGAGYLWSLTTLLVLAACFLGAAALIAPRSWQDRPVSGRVLPGGAGSPPATRSAAFRTRLLDVNPYFWLAVRPRVRVVYPWLIYLGLAAGWGWGLAKFGEDWFNIGIYVATVFFSEFHAQGVGGRRGLSADCGGSATWHP